MSNHPLRDQCLAEGPSVPASLDPKKRGHCLEDRDILQFPSQGVTLWQIKKQREAVGQAERTLPSAANLPLRETV